MAPHTWWENGTDRQLYRHGLGERLGRSLIDQHIYHKNWRRRHQLEVEEAIVHSTFIDRGQIHGPLPGGEGISLDGRFSQGPWHIGAGLNGRQCRQSREHRTRQESSLPQLIEAH